MIDKECKTDWYTELSNKTESEFQSIKLFLTTLDDCLVSTNCLLINPANSSFVKGVFLVKRSYFIKSKLYGKKGMKAVSLQ